jgi:hypothetical protein
MALRPNIGSVIRQVGLAAQASATQLLAGGTKKWMLDHREELLTVIEQAKTERGAQLLNEFCKQFPVAAGIVAVAMKGTPEMAIAAISFYDEELANRLRPMRANIELLQGSLAARGGRDTTMKTRISKTEYPFIGNAATGVVHRKRSGGACRVAEIKEENRENFQTLAQALKLKRGGLTPYRSCKKCFGG